MILIIISISELITVFCGIGLWRQRVSLFRKIIWSLILVVPILGPFFYAGMFDYPPVHGERSGMGDDGYIDDVGHH